MPRIARELQNGELDSNCFFVFETDKHPAWAMLSSSGAGMWLDGQLRAQTPFQIENEKIHLISEGAALFSFLHSQLEDENSTFGFSERWHKLSSEQKLIRLFQTPLQLEEVQNVMQWVLVSEEKLWPSSNLWQWRLSRHAPEKGWIFDSRTEKLWII